VFSPLKLLSELIPESVAIGSAGAKPTVQQERQAAVLVGTRRALHVGARSTAALGSMNDIEPIADWVIFRSRSDDEHD